ncbi:MAG: flagellin [Pseudomonas sp.]|uniref:flagellin N-terminal helical domain-containing protein n=1 Tax=Pseudomonas sp. UMAB-08 TaxID=1365375 RepID=UPI001C5A1BDE|nr:flagellin [Pseudomonas sp. UMAB-08]
MALTVNTNVASLSVQRNLNRSSDAVSTSMARLSSGLRINSAKDDAAGMQIASRLTTQIKGMTVAARNAGNAISIAQTAEGALQESTNNLQRMRELAIQSKNGDNSQKERDALNSEFNQSVQELTRLSKSTTFGGGLKLLDGSAGTMTFHVGANVGRTEEISLSLSDDFSAESLFIAAKSAAAVLGDDKTTGSVEVVKGEYTALAIDGRGSRNLLPINVTEKMTDDALQKNTALAAAESALGAIDAVADPAAYTAQQAAVATAKTEADGATTILKDATELDKKSKPLNDQAMADNIEATIISIDKALETIDAARSNLGAKQNRFASTISNLNNMVKNTTAARGQIEDVDFASETAELTKQQTLQQASTAVLAQANQLPAAVLKLLQ